MRNASAGIDRLLSGQETPLAARLQRGRVAMLTNDLALTRELVAGSRALVAAGWRFEAFFSPEHGLSGRAKEGDQIGDGERDGVPVRSLYGDAVAPDRADLAGLDAVLVDLPDVGSRFYTYVWTISHLLESCAAAGVEVVVLDRPNPLGGDLELVEGPILDEECQSLVGRWPMPIRHSLTVGELCRHWVSSRGIDVELTVVGADIVDRRSVTTDSGTWMPPSPNMPSPLTALLYPGTCLAEGVNLAEGRGTGVPFRVFAAPFLDGEQLADGVRGLGLPGLSASPYGFTPLVRDHVGVACDGVILHVTDPSALRPVHAGVRILALVAEQVGDALQERRDVPMPGESEATALEKLFGRRGAFAQIAAGEWNDPAAFAVPSWRDDVESDLIYR